MENKLGGGVIETTAVIVTFHPEMDNLLKLCSTAKKTKLVNVVIVDNNSLSVEQIKLLNESYTVVRLADNLGIAKAQNEGIKKAISNSSKYVVFFDQDSTINADFFSLMISDVKSLERDGVKLGTIGPVFKDIRYGFFYDVIKLNPYGIRRKVSPKDINKITEVSLIISSGSLVPINTLEKVGNLDEDLFIDYVDTEWCLRAISKGYSIYVTPNVVMEHAIGDNFINVCGKKIPVHSAFRRYYRIRNAFYFIKMKHIPFLLTVRDLVFNILHQLIIIANSKNKSQYFKSLFNGIKDGLFNLIK